MNHTHSLAEWAAFLSLGFVPLGVLALALVFAEADLAYFDPRPVFVRAVESGVLDPLLISVGPALAASREAARDAAALLVLLATSPKAELR